MLPDGERVSPTPEPVDERPLNKRQRAELQALRDNQQRLIAFDGGAELLPWVTAHRHHKDAPYIGCLFCRESFVPKAELVAAEARLEGYEQALAEAADNLDKAANQFAGLRIEHVQQEDEWGCGIAVLAMLTGKSYADVDAAFPHRLGREDERDKCVKPHEMYGYLWDQGYSIRVIRDRRYAINGHNGIWPSLVPFAPMHYAMVDSPTLPTGHWIALDGNARVFDPFSHLRDTLGAYGKMHEVVGVWPALAAAPSPQDKGGDDAS